MKRAASYRGRRFLLVLAGCVSALGVSAVAEDLSVTVNNVGKNRGMVHVFIFEASGWLDGNPENFAGSRSIDINERKDDGPLVTQVELEPGEYGAFVYHDLNSNSRLDKSFVGLPKEPYAFSGQFNERRLPKFEECMFVVGEDPAAITVSLNK